MEPVMDPTIDLTIRAGLGLLFAVAAWHKLRDPRHFTATLAEYRLLPRRLAPAAAACVILAELGVVVALVSWPSTAAAAGAALLTLYGTAITVNLARGRRHIDCGCAGPAARREIGGWLVARNALVAGAALAAGLLPVAPRSLVWLDACTILAATAMLAACWAATDHLVALAPGLARLREAE
jgi:uncharacterized membrane protein YphA (DoxX/SURF4 family)